MSTLQRTKARHSGFDETFMARSLTMLAKASAAVIRWRAERVAIAQLQAMSDRDLADIGLVRGQERAAATGKLRL